ncbi:MAG: sortase [Oscillospiraceae bacterium]|nr:sortase [Lachnospiraceae bacterium]MBR0161810.1 sortase [Oscillospiraceae bacterium]
MSRKTWVIILVIFGVACIAAALWYPISRMIQDNSAQSEVEKLRSIKAAAVTAAPSAQEEKESPVPSRTNAPAEIPEKDSAPTNAPVLNHDEALTPTVNPIDDAIMQPDRDQVAQTAEALPDTPTEVPSEAAGDPLIAKDETNVPAPVTAAPVAGEKPATERTGNASIPVTVETEAPVVQTQAGGSAEAVLTEATEEPTANRMPEEQQQAAQLTEEAFHPDPVVLTEDELEQSILPQLRPVYEMNHDLIGWLTIPGTDVDHPVVQTPQDNEYYLYRDFEGKDNKNGTLILDGNCDPWTPGRNLIIYGHNMRSGLMFGQLDQYLFKDYCREHRLIRFDTLNRERTYVVIAAVQSTQIQGGGFGSFRYTAEFEDEEDLGSWLDYIRRRRRFDTDVAFDTSDRYLTLSTCAYHDENGRLLIIARELRPDEDPEHPEMEELP